MFSITYFIRQWRNPWIKFIVLFVLCISFFIIYQIISDSKYEDITLFELINKIENKEIERISINQFSLLSYTYDNEYIEFSQYKTKIGTNTDIIELLLERDILSKDNSIKIEYSPLDANNIVDYISKFIFGIILIFIGYVFFKQMSPMFAGIGTSVINSTGVLFDDVAGIDDCKEELKETVDFLKNPKEFNALGARVPKGVLLVGPPGTGKTLLARAVAGEAKVPFYNVSGSEFVEMFVGLGASRVRSLFKKAKKNAPCIVFIDEIDAIGGHRGSVNSHSEREQTLNQILIEMDGFEKNSNIVIIAATNRKDTIDSALIRPGRFDRVINLNLPNIQDRIDILKVHTIEKPLDNSINLGLISRQTSGFSGADLSNLSNEASILAARKKQTFITINDFDEAIERITNGNKRNNNLLSEYHKKIIAYHELGHAFVAYALPDMYAVHKISIIARGDSGGHTSLIPFEEDGLFSAYQLYSHISTMLAGRAAEHIFFNEITTGSNDDIKHATELATSIVMEYGLLKEFNHRYLNFEDVSYGSKLMERIDDSIETILDFSYKQAHKIIFDNQDVIKRMAKYLMEHETISESEFESFVKYSDSENIVDK